MSTGYISEYNPDHPLAMRDGYVLQHRRVAWDAGIITRRGQQVHHINHDKTDNQVENLAATVKGKHQSDHLTERGYVLNQFGKWTVGRPAAERNHENYMRQKEKGNR